MTYGPGHASGTTGELVPGSLARYLPFGDWCTQPSADLTDIGFIGHKGNNLGSSDIGLIYMNACYYVPGVNRFLSADSIVPDPTNPQSLNRYSYSYNNPLNLTDPSGHCGADVQTIQFTATDHLGNPRTQSYTIRDETAYSDCVAIREQLEEDYGWTIKGSWLLADVQTILDAGIAISDWFARNGGGDANGRLREVFDGTVFKHADLIGEKLLGAHHVRGSKVFLLDGFDLNTVVHELGHILDNYFGFGWPIGSALFGGGAADSMANFLGGYPSICNTINFRSGCPGYDTPNEPAPTNYAANGPSEDFADSFMLSVLDNTGFSASPPLRSTYLNDLADSLTVVKSN